MRFIHHKSLSSSPTRNYGISPRSCAIQRTFQSILERTYFVNALELAVKRREKNRGAACLQALDYRIHYYCGRSRPGLRLPSSLTTITHLPTLERTLGDEVHLILIRI